MRFGTYITRSTQCMDYDHTSFSIHNHAAETEHGSRRVDSFVDGPTAGAGIVSDLLATHLPFDVDFTISCTSCSFELDCVTVNVSHGIQGIIAVASSDVMPRRRLNPLRTELRSVVTAFVRETIPNAWSFACLLLQLAELATSHLQENQAEQFTVRGKDAMRTGWDATSIKDWADILDDARGVDLLTVNDTAKFLLGQSISKICAGIDQWHMRILHVEPVFRSDLVLQFLQRRREMKEELMQLSHHHLRESVKSRQDRSRKLENSIEGIAEYLSTPVVSLYGAPRSVVSSIVRYGFVKPGEEFGKTGIRLGLRCGASYGIGVYSSPSIEYASGYTVYGEGNGTEFRHPSDVPGLRIVVCATLLGRALRVAREQTRQTTDLFRNDADSHVSPSRLEYVVFDTAQIIPCYVLHLDYGADQARRHFDRLSVEPTLFLRSNLKPRIHLDADDDSPGARQAKAEALKAAAAKWFPYGYGPAKGTTFVIEEIGAVNDDEEEYGEFQQLRGETTKPFVHPRASHETSSWSDEYQMVRHSKGEVSLWD